MNNFYQDTDPSGASTFEPDELPASPRRTRRRTINETAPSPAISLPAEPAAGSFATQPRPAARRERAPQQEQRPRAEQSQKPQPAPARQTKGPNLLKRLAADGRPAIFAGIICLVAALYVIVAFISFFASAGAADESILHSGGIESAIESTASVKNAAGPLGAWLSQKLITDSMGVGAVMIPVFLTLLGLGLVGLRRAKFWSITAKCLISMIAISIVVGMVTFSMTTSIYWGGRHGHDINMFLLQTTGLWGMLGVSIILVAALVLIFIRQISETASAIAAFARRRREAANGRRKALDAEREAREKAEQERADIRAQAREEGRKSDMIMEQAAGEVAETDKSGEEATVSSDEKLDFEASDAPLSDLGEIFDEPLETEKPESFTGETAETPVTVAEAPPIETAEPETEEKCAHHSDNDRFDPTASLGHYRKPTLDLLIERPVPEGAHNEAEQKANIDNIRRVLGNFGIGIAKINATVGPTVTLYEIVPAEGVRINKIRSLEDDIALSLSAIGIRIIAPMPGKGTIGIEVPNAQPQVVSIRSILSSKKFQETKAELPMAMGATISNEVYIADLTKMPHLLVAGSTGMGKSVGLNTIIASILYKKHPAEVKFVLIDPKMVEFSIYNKIQKDFLAKLPGEDEAIITNMDKVVPTLLSLCIEMDQRYELLKAAGVRAIKEYNEKFVNYRLNPDKGHRYMPYIVVVIDEFADLIMTAGKEVETPIARIAQKARAVGIHVILATQRPSANIITGVIRANFPGRIAFRVTQQLESRIILDRSGANQLIGRGDMLFSRDGVIDRVQCAFIDTPEVQAICDFIGDQVSYPSAYELPEYVPPATDGADGFGGGMSTDRDPLFEAAARLIIEENVGSTSLVQRRMEIGYPRAAKIMEQLERAGIVGPAQGGKPRKVNMTMMDFEMWLSATGTTQYQPASRRDDI